MALRTTYSAETWEAAYQAFSAVNFTAYDFDTVKQSLIDYTRIYYAEQFNDFIQSSEFIALLEIFAYICEQMAYRVDMVAHENFITTAQRKQSVLRLAKLISYKATRNIPLRGLVKVSSISTTEQVVDSRGINLSGLTINWNDPNNPNWKEQFFLVMNRVLNSRFGNPQKTYQIGDVVMDLYSLRNNTAALPLGVFAFSASTGVDTFNMEIVPADIDENGPFEREPDPTSPMTVIYANDGIGDGSDYTGFLLHVKQGVLSQIELDIVDLLPNRRLDFDATNVNDTDVWVQRIDDDGNIIERWTQVETIAEQNLMFNSNRDTRRKYEVDTLENDRIRIMFGDGDFVDIPRGTFRFWLRQSLGRSVVVQKNRITNEPFPFTYTGVTGNTETCTLRFGLVSALQNASATESIESIRRSAPATYYSQNRMVNGQDYNTFMLKDPSILRLKAINRTFAGQPKYIDWNDASGQYENIKLFGDDLSMKYILGVETLTTSVSGQVLIDRVIEPLLSTPGIINMLLHISANDPATVGVVSSPRRQLIEDNRGGIHIAADGSFVDVLTGAPAGDGSLKEKTALQAYIDQHYYGEPLEFVTDSNNNFLARIPDPDLFPKDDSRIYAANVPRTIDGVNRFPPGDTGSGLQPIAEQEYFGLRFNRYMQGIGDGSISTSTANNPGSDWLTGGYFLPDGEVFTVEMKADGVTFDVRSNKRGSFPAGEVGVPYLIQPSGFSTPAELLTVTQGLVSFEQGDAFVLDVAPSGIINQRAFPPLPIGRAINLNGWWEVMKAADMPDYGSSIPNAAYWTTSDQIAPDNLKQHSWLIFVRKVRNPVTSEVISYEVHHRTLSLVVTSPTTKFWYNAVDQLIDSETQKRVFDNIKVLRSNKDALGNVISASQIYDVVGAVKDNNGVIDVHSLSVMPSDLLNEDDSGNLIPDRLLQFEMFAGSGTGSASYEYFLIGPPEVTLPSDPLGPSAWAPASMAAYDPISTNWYGRRLRMTGQPGDPGLDFMWQHFSPFTNIIDPSVTNIHDIYLMTRGYYDNVINYIRGIEGSRPTPPTPLELRSSYGYLLNNKMLSDTIVLHPGKIKLLFGALAEPQLRAKFKVVRQATAILTNERIKEEILNVINTFFDIDNWDFGQTFYATELITLIHQRLPSDVASVVLVPVYSTNSFGALFTVESGHDEILQSAAQLADIEIVEALTPTIIRQVR
jgi:hypothetical protein